MIVILHNIRSSHNVGSIFRTADAFGYEKIFLCGITPAPIDRFGRKNAQLCKVSLGAEKSVVWEQCAETISAIRRLKEEGYRIIALEQDDRSILYDNRGIGDKKIALIVGDEVNGISIDILDICDLIVEIPMRGTKESLNVSVAFGIAVAAFCRK